MRILCFKQFNKEGKDIRDQIAVFSKNLATKILDPNCLEAYTTNRLILSDKNQESGRLELGKYFEE